MSERITGILHGTVTPKRRGGLLDQLLVAKLAQPDDRKFYYAPRYWLSPADGRRYLWSVADRSKLAEALTLADLGHLFTIDATVTPWANGIGAKLTRASVIARSDGPVEHECGNTGSGPCTPWLAEGGDTNE